MKKIELNSIKFELKLIKKNILFLYKFSKGMLYFVKKIKLRKYLNFCRFTERELKTLVIFFEFGL